MPFVGEIRMFAGNFAPAGWMLCQGQILPISENEVLFNLIGTTYGGDGQSTFALPDLSSRVPMHFGAGFVLAQTGGEESVTLTVSQIPSHTHVPSCVGAAGGSGSPNNARWAANSDTSINPYTGASDGTTMNAGSIAQAGGSQPHDNMIPFLAINFIISLFGVFPAQ
jgi:microcystin-dependent protein